MIDGLVGLAIGLVLVGIIAFVVILSDVSSGGPV